MEVRKDPTHAELVAGADGHVEDLTRGTAPDVANTWAPTDDHNIWTGRRRSLANLGFHHNTSSIGLAVRNW